MEGVPVRKFLFALLVVSAAMTAVVSSGCRSTNKSGCSTCG
ncbi:hypothetical protein FRUB_02780 [Fimbriiglobus ruber]|uniref:Uncharacterized protein n=1 Tax=Fimbriiglobus ruber TaxID=1908690 RepID=A0A225DPF3_9BACT|nr:hypothetical protein FRUB_02780 [Fimbriiglobus ruber]